MYGGVGEGTLKEVFPLHYALFPIIQIAAIDHTTAT